MSDDEVTAAKASLWSSWVKDRRWAIVRWASLAIGLMLIGGAISYLVMPPTAAPQKVFVLPPAAAATADAAEPMPSVAGLSVETARLVLRDAGSSAKVVTSTIAAPGSPGLVVTQSPAPGEEIEDKVELTLSAPLAMPPVIGQNALKAQAALQEKGAVVRIVTVVKPGTKLGTVLGTVPQAGQTMPAVVTLRVADPGKSISLGEVSSSDSDGCDSSTSISIGSVDYDSSVNCSIQDGTTSYLTYQLGGKALTMSFLVGYNTDAGRGTGTLRVIGDGRTLLTVQPSAKAARKTVDISGIQELRIEVGGTSDSVDNPAAIGLGAPVFQGRPSEIDELGNF